MDVNKKIGLNIGITLTLLLSVIPMFAWKIGYNFDDMELWRIIALSLAKAGAFGGMAMFALSLALSGRYRWYDRLFGGLDKMYLAHRFLGTFSLILLLIHPLALSVLQLENGFTVSLSLWLKLSDFGILLGAFALYLLLALVVWSTVAKSKYETFIKVHRILGLTFILGAVHAFMSGSILAANSFMFWYLLVLTLVGSLTFVVHSLLGDLFHRPLRYRVKNIERHPDGIVELQLEPLHRIINFAPGQFVYLAFDDLEKHGYHPFSISSDKRSSVLTLAIRESGDFTRELESLRVGSLASVKGPYGGFVLELNSKRKQLWIAGGIGVTPFLSGAASLPGAGKSRDRQIEMIYATDDTQPFGLDILQSIEDRNKIFNVTLFHKKTFGHVSFDMLKHQIADLADRDIYICGPPPMLRALQKEAEEAGFAGRLKYEEFSY